MNRSGSTAGCHGRGSLRSLAVSAPVALVLGGIGLAHAQQPVLPAEGDAALRNHSLDIGVAAGINRSDNIRRDAINEESGSYGRAGVLLAYQRNGPRLNAEVEADVAYEHYFDDEFDSDVVGGLNGRATLGLVPGRFEWHAQNNFGQVTMDPFAAITPENRQNINYFTTGPDLYLRLTGAMRMRLSGRYSSVLYEESQLDSNRYSAGAALERELSDSSMVSLNVQTETIKYDDAEPSEYDSDEAFIGFEARGSRTSIDLSLGYTVLRVTDSDDSGGLLARLVLSRQLTPGSGLTLMLGREFADAGDLFRLQQDLTGVSQETQSTRPIGDPFTNEYATLRWEVAGLRTGLGFGVGRFEEHYETATDADRTRIVLDANAYRDLRPNVRLELFASTSKEEARNLAIDFRETRAVASLSWQPSLRVTLALQYEHIDRDSDLVQEGYVENRAWLGVRYGSTLARTAAGVSYSD